MTKVNTEFRDRFLAILLAIIMVVAMIPFSAITAYASAPYHLTYDKNTAETVTNMPEDSTDYGEDETATVSTTEPLCEGYTFDGWYLEAGCNTPSGATISMTKDTTLYAKWITPHTHSFDFSAVENKLTATCNATGTCDLPENKVTLTLSAPDNLVYSGESKNAVITGTSDWEAVGLDVPSITYNENPKNVGNYTATIKKGDASAIVNFEITKANPVYTTPTPSAEFGQTLQDVDLPEGFSWQTAVTTSVGDIGTHSFLATFTPEDTDNYKIITDIDVTITVNKASRTIIAPAIDSDFTATQTEIRILPVTPSKGDGTVEYGVTTADKKDDLDTVSWQSGTSFTGLEGSTTYYFFARVTGSDLYADAISGGASYSTANKKNATVTLSIEGWIYGETANTPEYNVSEGDYAAPVVEYAVKDGTVWSTEVPNQAGQYSVRVTYYATNVYGEASNSVDFTIEQKEVTLTWSNYQLTYNSENQKPTAEIASGNIDGENLSVTVSGQKEDVGEYTATASLTGTAANNYKIRVADQTKSFTIDAKEITITWSNTSLTHSQNKQKPIATINDGEIFDGDNVVVEVSGEKKRPGNYTAAASLTGDQAANYVIKEDLKECEFVISNLETPANPFKIVRADNTAIEAFANDNHWYNYDVIILPAEGYQIGVADESNNDFSDYLEITECKENFRVFLRKIATGEFTGEIAIGTAFNNENSNINIDKVVPKASATLSEETIWDTILETVTFGLYHNSERVVTIGGTDELSTVDKVYYYVLSTNRLSNTDLFENNGTGTGKDITAWTEWTEGTSVNVNTDNDYVVYGKVIDKAGNITYTSTRDFVYDATKPTISVSFDGSALNGKYFKADRTATITITDHNFDESKVVLSVTEGGVDTSANYTLSWDPNGDVYTATVSFTNEADYTFGISCEDKAGNSNDPVNYGTSIAPTEFTIDKSHPNATIVIGGMVYGDSDPWESSWQTVDADSLDSKVLTSIDYNNRWTNSNAKVSATSSDSLSGIDYIEFFKAAELKTIDEINSWTSTKGTSEVDRFAFEVAPNESFIVYVHIVDKAGNEIYLSSNGIIVDDKAPEGDNYSPNIDITLPKTNANGFYNDTVEVKFKVVEPKYIGSATKDQEQGVYSGIKEITYVIKADDMDATEIDSFDLSKGSVLDENGLLSSWTGSIEIDKDRFNSNNVIVTITAVDNAGNVRTSTTKIGDIQIDVTAPEIDISYNNNAVDSNSYFKADRTATIVVTERNFRADDVKITLTNTDGVIPKLSDWTKKDGAGNNDNTAWTATILYSSDGDYKFDISYIDLADNTCPGADYGDSVAPQEFTIDKTNPVIVVTYNNNAALNTNYYKADRTATIEITEHNFSTDRVVITLNATDDGAPTTAPKETEWTTKGDKHTATIHYANDALYTFDIAYTDLAGNEAADYQQDTFFVDKTAPKLDITGVADKSANNGKISPVISYSDTNFDSEKVTITLTGVNNGKVNYSKSTTDIHNGQTVTYVDFEKVKEVDDLYTLTATLTDKAGNETTKTIFFSANRFGSVYDLTALKDILNKYLQNEEDIVFTETNVDTLDRKTIKIVLTKNGTPQDLAERTDYEVVETGGDGQWSQYKYTIKKSLFSNDGRYSVSIYSVDAAGNVNENIDETKEAEISFGIDKTAPVIIPIDFESGVQYAVDIKTVSIEIKDNLVLESVNIYLNDKVVDYKVDGETYTFDIPEQNSTQDVRVVATDAAGNEYEVSVGRFLVSTNIFVRWYNDTPLFAGSLAGVGAIGIGTVAFFVFRKKKKVKA